MKTLVMIPGLGSDAVAWRPAITALGYNVARAEPAAMGYGSGLRSTPGKASPWRRDRTSAQRLPNADGDAPSPSAGQVHLWRQRLNPGRRLSDNSNREKRASNAFRSQ